jgi:hypothetical protein
MRLFIIEGKKMEFLNEGMWHVAGEGEEEFE